MSTTLNTAGAAAAAEVLAHMRSRRNDTRTTVMSEPARQVLEELIGRYARTANSARQVSAIVLPSLPGDEDFDDAPVFADLGEAQAWYLDNAPGIWDAMVLASRHGADRHSPRLVRNLERVLSGLHDIDAQLELVELALAAARRSGDRAAEAQLLLNRGGTFKMAGRSVTAAEDYAQALRLLTTLEDRAGTLVALSRLAVAWAAARQLDEADDALDQVLALSTSGDVLRALAYVNRAWVATQRGDAATAIAQALVGLDVLEEVGAERIWLVEAHLQLATAYTNVGDLEQARQHLNEASMLGFEGAPQRVAGALATGALLLEQGCHRDALEAFQRAVVLQSAAASRYRMADAIDGIGRALFGLGEYDQAAEQHTSALPERIRLGEPFATASTRLHLANAQAASGRSDEATNQRGQALAELAGLVDPAADALRAELNQLPL